MRVLVVHNFYRSANASGENLSVLDEVDGLRSAGWDVELLSADSDLITDGTVSSTKAASRAIYSRPTLRRVDDALARFRPHVALVENLFPLHSPWVIRHLHAARVPVAAGVRSYRNWCVASNHFRNGHLCHDCLGSVANGPAVIHGCYQDSRVASVPMAVSLTVHRRTWPLVDAFLAVTEFVRDYLVSVGVPSQRVEVRPNFVEDPGAAPDRGTGFVYAGRLTLDKGVGLLLDAWRLSGLGAQHSLTIAGSGPFAGQCGASAGRDHVKMVGLTDNAGVMELLRRNAVAIMPSLWDEPFGRGVIEAAAVGRPSVVTDRGGLASLVVHGETGWVAGAEPHLLAKALRDAAAPLEQARRGRAARLRYERCYTRQVSLGILDRVLRRLIASGPLTA